MEVDSLRVLKSIERNLILEESLKWLGVPYKLYGKDNSGVDCSQFVLGVYRNALGIELISRTDGRYLASKLLYSLKVIPLGQLQISDLVFFCKSPRPQGRIATHIAIYIGDGNIIHSSYRAKKVLIEPIDNYQDFLLSHKDETIISQWLKNTG